MLKARKANRVIRIADSQKRQYEALGYKITDMAGHVISAPIDKDAVIADLKAQIAQLEKQLAEAQAKAEPETTPETTPAAEPEQPAPKKKTSRKKAE